MAGFAMGWTGNHGMTRSERLKRTLMMCCALVLFVLGIWLLIKPVEARSDASGIGVVDNVVASDLCCAAAGNGMLRG